MSIIMEENKSLSDGIDMMKTRIARAGVPSLSAPVCLKVEAEGLLSKVASLISMTLKIRKNFSIDSHKIEEYLKTLLEYRIMQLENSCPMASRDVIVPSFFMPVLSAIARYEDPMRALRLHVVSTQCDTLTVAEMEEVGFMLSSAGVKCVRGLPRTMTADSDAIFRVASVDGELRVAGSDVGELILLIRSVVRIEFSAEVFGTARTRYLSIEDCVAPWESIAGMSVE